MTKKNSGSRAKPASPATLPDAVEDRPQRGGSYRRDPLTGALTLIAATDLTPDADQPDADQPDDSQGDIADDIEGDAPGDAPADTPAATGAGQNDEADQAAQQHDMEA